MSHADGPGAAATSPVRGTVPVEKSPRLHVRSEEPFNGGPPPELQAESFVTPLDLFFVRNHAPVPRVDRDAFRLTVEGLVERPLELSLADLAGRFERREVAATLVCAGQRRLEMMAVREIPGELPWGAEAASNAVWSGWSLADVLAAAVPREAAAHAAFTGLDEVERHGERFGFGGSIPRAKALAPEVLLADRMNGEPLPPTHGAPLRVVVPGYIGARSVKWVSRIELRETSSDNYFQSRAYRLYPPDMTLETLDPSQGFELGELSVSCRIADPSPTAEAEGSGEPVEVAAGRRVVRGFAWAGGGRAVMRVEVSTDGGATWTTARLDDGGSGGSGWVWRLFHGEVELPPGEGEIVARAWDAAGQTQPSDPAQLWNCKGYMNNAWSRVRVVAR